jgi:signal transduction histidine kinase
VPQFAPKTILRGFLSFALYCLAGQLAVWIHKVSGFSPLIWLPSGVGVASLVLTGRRNWPWIFIAALTLGLSLKYSFIASIGLALGASVEAYIAAWSLAKVSDRLPTLTQVKEVVCFALVAMVLATFLSTAISIGFLYFSGSVASGQVSDTWRSWWLGEAMGCLAVGAPAICWWNDIRFRLKEVLKGKSEALLLALAIVATCMLIYTPLAVYNTSIVIRPYFLFCLMIWAALRFDVFGAIYTLLVLIVSVICGTLLGFTAATTVPFSERLVLQQFFVIALGLTGLVISAAIREKEEAVEMRNQFLSIASHELKTPITALSLQLQVAERRLLTKKEKNPTEIEQLQFLGKTSQQIGRLTQIVEQLLDVSRIDRDAISLGFEEFDLSAFIGRLVLRLESNLASAQCLVSLNVQSDLICKWDALRFEQVLENILSNAMKYAPRKPIEISAKNENGMIDISVRDQGPGIEESKQSLIFDRFIRANSSPQIKGLGLGLFITRQIVEAHGGKIWVESKMGEGSSFRIRMPARPIAAVTSTVQT